MLKNLNELTNNNEIIVSLVQDIFSCFGIPTDTLKTLYKHHISKKISDARKILIDEIPQGNNVALFIKAATYKNIWLKNIVKKRIVC